MRHPKETMDFVVLAEAAIFKLGFMVAVGAAWWALMRLVRRSQGVVWAEVWGEMKAGNLAVALHAGLLALALAVAMGLAAG